MFFRVETSLMKRYLLLAVVGISLAIITGCQSDNAQSDRIPLGYFSARGHDFLDILRLNGGVSENPNNFLAVLSVEPLAVGGGVYTSQKLGIDGRRVGCWTEERIEVALLIDCLLKYKKTPLRGNRYLFDGMYAPLVNRMDDESLAFSRWGMTHRLFARERKPLDLTVEAHLVFAGLEIGLSPVEALDFLAGLVTIDAISNDDWVNPRGWYTSPLAEGAAPPEPMITPTQNDMIIEMQSEAADSPGQQGATPGSGQDEMILEIETVPSDEMFLDIHNVPEATPVDQQEVWIPSHGEMILEFYSVPVAAPADQQKVWIPSRREMILTLAMVPTEPQPASDPVSEWLLSPVEQDGTTAATSDNATAAAPLSDWLLPQRVKSTPREMVLTLTSPAAQSETQLPTTGRGHTTTTPPPGEVVFPTSPATPTTEAEAPVMVKTEAQTTEAYQERRQQTSFREPEELYLLAKWCEANKLTRKKIWHLRQTIALNPNHEEARKMLGYEKHGDRWYLAKAEMVLDIIVED